MGTGPQDQPASAGAFTLITKSLLAAPAASIDISAIPATYSHLRVLALLQAVSGVGDTLQITFNGDAGTNYEYQGSETLAAAAPANQQAQTQNAIRAALYGSFTSVFPAVLDLLIPAYANTTFNKIALINAGYSNAGQASAGRFSSVTGVWHSTAAINRITFTAQSGDNMNTGCLLSLYGLS